MEQSELGSNRINLFIVCVMFLLSITPMFNASVPMMVKVSLNLLWILEVLYKKSRAIPVKPLVVIPIILLFIIFSYKILGISSAEWGNYAIQLYFYTSIWMMMYINESYSDDDKQKLAFFCLAVISINIVSNIYMFYNLSNYTSWSYVGASKIDEYVRRYNLGSTSFVSAITLFWGVITSLLVEIKQTKKRILFTVINCMSLFYLIVCSGRATTIILLSFMIILFILYRKSRTPSVVPLIITMLFLVIYLFRVPIIELVANILPNERMAVRINAIAQYLSGTTDGGLYLERIKIIALDFSTWLRSAQSFLFGIGDHRYLAGNLSDIYSIGISGHSDYFDFLAQYGLVGFTLVNFLFLELFNYFRYLQIDSDKMRRYLVIVLAIFFCRSLVGSVFSMDIASIMFVFAPVAFSLTNERKQE